MDGKIPDVDDSGIVAQHIALVESILLRRLSDVDEKRKEGLISVIKHMGYAVRLPMLPHGTGIESLWKWIRKFDSNTEAVLDLFTEYRFRVPKSDDDFKRLVSQLATSLTAINSGNGCVIDTTITDRMVSQTDVKNKILANPWLVPLILLVYSDKLIELLNALKDVK